MSEFKLAVVTGANRGIGYEICRQLAKQDGINVILTSRDKIKGQVASQRLEDEGLKIGYRKLDVNDADSIADFAKDIESEFGRCDILVNNAGIFPDATDASSGRWPSVFEAKPETINQAMQTNVFGPLLLSQALVPLMKKNGYGRIVNMSSGMGQLTNMNGHCTAYRLSKTSLNALTRIMADELKDENVLVNSMCPGWVKTEMGGEGATRELSEGADTAIYLATLADGGPSGLFFRDRKEFAW